jgi:hypothetical protein
MAIPSVNLADFLSGNPELKQSFVQSLGKAYGEVGMKILYWQDKGAIPVLEKNTPKVSMHPILKNFTSMDRCRKIILTKRNTLQIFPYRK